MKCELKNNWWNVNWKIIDEMWIKKRLNNWNKNIKLKVLLFCFYFYK